MAAIRRSQRGRIANIDGSDPIDVHVGQRLRMARNLAGLNQTELGDEIGVSFQAVQKYEEGDNRISASRLFAAAKALECSVAFFFEGANGSPSSDEIASSSFGAQELAFIRAFRRIKKTELRESIRRLINEVGRSRSNGEQAHARRLAG